MVLTFEQIKKSLGENLDNKVSNYIKESLGQLELPQYTETSIDQTSDQPSDGLEDSNKCACCLDKLKTIIPTELHNCISYSKFSNWNADCTQFDYKIIFDNCLDKKSDLESLLLQGQYKKSDGSVEQETEFKCKEKEGRIYCKGCYCETGETSDDVFFKEFEAVTESETVAKLSPATADKKIVEALPDYFKKYSSDRTANWDPTKSGKLTIKVENLTDCSFDFKMFVLLDETEDFIKEARLPRIIEDLKKACKSDKMMAKIVLGKKLDKEHVSANKLVVFGSFNC